MSANIKARTTGEPEHLIQITKEQNYRVPIISENTSLLKSKPEKGEIYR
jgi:hypothetical protein